MTLIDDLAVFARSEFELSAVMEDGCSLRAHLEAIERATGTKPPELEQVRELPKLASYIWGYFCEMHRCRNYTGAAYSRITHSQILDYCRLKKISMSQYEINAIERIDSIWMESQKAGK